jgi:hypothetical protein
MDDRQIGARLMTSIQWLLDHDRVDECNDERNGDVTPT